MKVGRVHLSLRVTLYSKLGSIFAMMSAEAWNFMSSLVSSAVVESDSRPGALIRLNTAARLLICELFGTNTISSCEGGEDIFFRALLHKQLSPNQEVPWP